MFDFAWSEIALIGGVALVLIGPKDMPVAIKAITSAIKKARRMAAEFQTHVDDMVRDADLHEVRDGIRQIRSMDIRGTIARAVDTDGSIRKTLMEDPTRDPPPVVTTPVASLPEHTIDAPHDEAPLVSAPAFIPPSEATGLEMPPHPPAAAPALIAPAFIPPEAARSPVATVHGA